MYTVFSLKWLGKEFNDHKTVTVSSMYTEFRTNNNKAITCKCHKILGTKNFT